VNSKNIWRFFKILVATIVCYLFLNSFFHNLLLGKALVPEMIVRTYLNHCASRVYALNQKSDFQKLGIKNCEDNRLYLESSGKVMVPNIQLEILSSGILLSKDKKRFAVNVHWHERNFLFPFLWYEAKWYSYKNWSFSQGKPVQP
jgi:hypothetical protein